MKSDRLGSALLVSLMLFTLAAGCAGPRRGGPAVGPPAAPPAEPPAAAPAPAAAAPLVDLPPAELWRLYVEAVEAAKYPRPPAISRELLPILRYTPELRWNDRGQVLMVTWTLKTYFPPDSVGKAQNLYGDTWLTAVPFTQHFCRSLGLRGEALDLRLKQYIGLPPDADKNAFVEMWIDPHDVFRPCPDPEITDHECQVGLGVDSAGESAPCPWAGFVSPTTPATFGDRFDAQLSQAFVTVADAHLQWMCSNWVGAYPAGDPRKGYPWTALGYTYDWGDPDDHVGASEFVAPARTPVVIASVTLTEEYCTAAP